MTDKLPIDDVLDELRAEFRARTRLVLAAPPGAGKTTRAPLALMDEDWARAGKLLVLEPRRIAARAAAARMAATLGEPIGRSIGLIARADVRTSKQARIEIVTEGVFSRMILDDPSLDGVSGVLFDEFHERSLDADFGLALALETQDALRPELRIGVMSATLDTARIAQFLDARVIESQGRAHPVDTRYVPPDPRRRDMRLADQVERAVRAALREETGSLLVFLPGAAEIRRTADRLSDLGGDIRVAPLYGALRPDEQDAAIRPAPTGARKIVLSTDIAESALTIEGVRVVIDAGLARTPRYISEIDAAVLETKRVTRANADQRRGRAGRTQAGVCYRLWDAAADRGLAAHPDPEILNADLTRLALDLAQWGAAGPDDLHWLDTPPAGAWRAAIQALERLGAIGPDRRMTERGRQLARLPLPPRLAAMIVLAGDDELGRTAAYVAALLSERGLGGRSVDLADRLGRLLSDRSDRAKTHRRLADRWADQAGGGNAEISLADPGSIIARAFPNRIARARPGKPGEFQLASGQGCFLDPADRLAVEPWLAVAELTGAPPRLRISSAAALDETDAMRLGDVQTVETGLYNPETTGVQARRTQRLGAIILEETPLPAPNADARRAAFLDVIRREGLTLLPSYPVLQTLAARISWLYATLGAPWPADFAADLEGRLDAWAPAALEGVKQLRDIPEKQLEAAATGLLDWSLQADLQALAPKTWTAPTGKAAKIDYLNEAGPAAAVKVQEVFGLTTHPTICNGRLPLQLSLLSPAQRPVALTQDIARFWREGGYADLRKDLRGRYPKHDWPEDPAGAVPQSGAKRRR